MRIYLIRHGETIWNAARILQYPDTPLSERGEEQAKQLGERMRDVPLRAILSSDYARAHATAEAVSRTTGVPIQVQQSLRERHLGDHRGTAFKDLQVDVFARDYAPPNGESWDKFHARVTQAWQQVAEFAGDDDGDIAVVSHALVCRAVVEREVSLPAALRPEQVRFGNTSVTHIEGPPFEVTLLGCTAHLPADQVTYPNTDRLAKSLSDG